jgi:hypothetical protein
MWVGEWGEEIWGKQVLNSPKVREGEMTHMRIMI